MTYDTVTILSQLSTSYKQVTKRNSTAKLIRFRSPAIVCEIFNVIFRIEISSINQPDKVDYMQTLLDAGKV